jgi:hypothetical protein
MTFIQVRKPINRRIDVTKQHELRDWAQRFRVTTGQLQIAVAKVGNEADAVQKHLNAY